MSWKKQKNFFPDYIMISHAPKNYICPICLGVKGIESEETLIFQSDILFKDDDVMVFVASFFIEGSAGHLIVVPTNHYENFYDLPKGVGAKIFETAQEYAVKMKRSYGCDGVNVLQNNEPAAGQHAFHYHLHLFPRYDGDDLWKHMGNKRLASKDERSKFVKKFEK